MIFREMVKWIRKPNKTWREQVIELLFVIIPVVFLLRTWGFGLYQVPTGSMETTMLIGERFFADKFTLLFKPPMHGDIICCNDPLFPYSENKVINAWQHYVWGPINWTKRVIGIPGDHIEGRIEDGKPVIYLNGKKLEEPYLNKYPLVATYDPNRKGREFTWATWNPDEPLAQQSYYAMTDQEIALGQQVAQHAGLPVVKLPQTPQEYEGRLVDNFEIHLRQNEYWIMGDNRLGSHDSRVVGPVKGDFIHGKIVFRLYSIDSNSSWWILDLLRHPVDFWTRIRWNRILQFVK